MEERIDLSRLQTEAINPHTVQIDQISTLQMCDLINEEDRKVATSVTPCIPIIAEAIDALTPRVRQGGRVIYVGAGTSGRLGILDASEIPPTFAAPSSQFVGLIAGGDAAIRQAQEGAEDSVQAGEGDLSILNLVADRDSVIGIAASGRTPYVLGCLAYAKRVGCLTIGVACAAPSAMSLSKDVDFMISPLPGAEIVAGSTRLKAGTATKLVLNMLSTGTMIKVGKTYGNMMVDVVASNLKLKQRSRNILRRLSMSCVSMSDAELDNILVACNRSVKLALMVSETGLPVGECLQMLVAAGGVLAKALTEHSDLNGRMKSVNVGDSQSRRYVLCVDGGGSKCAAVVADNTTGEVTGRGVAGACNLTDWGVEAAVETILVAVENALQSFNQPYDPSATVFSYIWIGLAGADRPGYFVQLTEALSQRLRIDRLMCQLRITNDVDLLAAAMHQYPGVASVIVLIAGTGSVCMRYKMDGSDLIRVARSGGWGHLLGDEGGGYAIGREAIQKCLAWMDDRRLGLRTQKPTILERAVSAYFGFGTVAETGCDLLSEVLSVQPDRTVKTRIAGAAQTVLTAAAASDQAARDIVSAQVSILVDTALSPLLNPRCRGYVRSTETVLVLSGGIMLNENYRLVFQTTLEKRGIRFKHVHRVSDAASIGASYLTSRQNQPT